MTAQAPRSADERRGYAAGWSAGARAVIAMVQHGAAPGEVADKVKIIVAVLSSAAEATP